MVTFVANNILNSITLNQAVTVVQQIALRDARQIVEEADEDKRKEILDAMEAAQQQVVDQQASTEQDSVSVPAPA
jgi:Mg/Co/Ni transporter MgtE